MSLKITEGISQSELPKWLENAAKKFGTFEDGRVNYKNADIAPVVMCVLKCGDEIFLAKRGYGLADTEGYWSTINGFIDENKPIAEIAAQEFKEELSLGIPASDIWVADSITVSANSQKRSYIVYACLVEVKEKPVVKLDREHTDSTWIKREQLSDFSTLPDLPFVIDRALSLDK